MATTAHAEPTVTPITWDIVGLDHNRPLSGEPELFAVGAKVCSDVATTGVQVDMVRAGHGRRFVAAGIPAVPVPAASWWMARLLVAAFAGTGERRLGRVQRIAD